MGRAAGRTTMTGRTTGRTMPLSKMVRVDVPPGRWSGVGSSLVSKLDIKNNSIQLKVPAKRAAGIGSNKLFTWNLLGMAKYQTHRCHPPLFGRLTEKGTAVARAKAGAVATTHGETVGTADVTRVGRGRRRVATARVATVVVDSVATARDLGVGHGPH